MFLIFSLHVPVRAQGDIQAMLKQIALLAVYMKDLEDAMKIAKDGLTTISEIKNGEFNLHSLFFSSLQSVNPSVAKYSKIAEIISDQVAIVSNFKNLINTTEQLRPHDKFGNVLYQHCLFPYIQ